MWQSVSFSVKLINVRMFIFSKEHCRASVLFLMRARVTIHVCIQKRPWKPFVDLVYFCK